MAVEEKSGSADNIKEIVIASGKGGTGKTSITACFAVLAGGGAVVADCDVDAADMHLILEPEVKVSTPFYSGHEAVIRQEDCIACGTCREYCRFSAVREVSNSSGEAIFVVDPITCEGCGVCVHFCPESAIEFPEALCGDWMISDTRCGPMVHARLRPAAENSGKLVSVVRREARRIARETGRELVLIDGPPGIGCPVIASITGTDLLLVVTEPTVSGEHDLKRLLSLANHFKIPAAVCVNKWDLHPGQADRIEKEAISMGAVITGRIHYDPGVTRSQIEARAAVEIDAAAAGEIRSVWSEILELGGITNGRK